jgi:hypothetical protein
VAASDSFITSTAGLELVSYKYSVLAAATGDKEQQLQLQLQLQQQQQSGTHTEPYHCSNASHSLLPMPIQLTLMAISASNVAFTIQLT